MLTQSPRLDDEALIEKARTKSQAHLLAISRRSRLSGAVTDVLVERGNVEVVTSAAGNPGAEFSENGYAKLIERAEGNDDLAACIGSRSSIPRHHLLKLIAKASETVRAKLKAAHPETQAEIDGAVKQVTANAQNRSAAGDVDVSAAGLTSRSCMRRKSWTKRWSPSSRATASSTKPTPPWPASPTSRSSPWKR